MRDIRHRDTNCRDWHRVSTKFDPETTASCLRKDFLNHDPLGTGRAYALSAVYAIQELTERHIEGCSKSRQMAKSHLARTPLKIRNVNLVNTRLFGEVDLPPASLLSKLPDSVAKLAAHIGVHAFSIDLVEALYLVDALSVLKRCKDSSASSLPDDGRTLLALIGTPRGSGEGDRGVRINRKLINLSTDCYALVKRIAMIHCNELSNKVVRLLTIYEDGSYGPEVHIEFTDGTTFSACLKANVSIEAKYIHDQGGEPSILRDYTAATTLR